MNELPPNQDEVDEVDSHYRRASALDPSRPSESVRRAVLELATQLAAERSAKNDATIIGDARPATNPTGRPTGWRRPAAFGTLAAAALAGLLIIPHFLAPDAPPIGALAPAPVRPNPAAAPASQAQTSEQRDVMTELQPPSPPPAEAESLRKSRVSPGNAAAVADLAEAIAAKNAPAKVQGNARSAAAEAGDTETDGRRTQTSGATADSAAAPPSAAPAAPAARLADSAAELRRAAEIGAVPELRTLLGKRPDIDARDESGRTALMLATLHGQTHAVDMLLASGADPNAADAHGITPLQAAIAGGQPSIVAALRRAGAR
jgi:Ankyrin repeats (3 copies)